MLQLFDVSLAQTGALAKQLVHISTSRQCGQAAERIAPLQA